MMHTPGPWRTDGRTIERVDPDDGYTEVLAEVYGETENTLQDDENQANAYLMAAAPDLLAAVKSAMAELSNECAGSDGIYKALRAAIAKAEGK